MSSDPKIKRPEPPKELRMVVVYDPDTLVVKQVKNFPGHKDLAMVVALGTVKAISDFFWEKALNAEPPSNLLLPDKRIVLPNGGVS